MAKIQRPLIRDALQRQRALAGWENEGGAGCCGALNVVASPSRSRAGPDMGKAELQNLHIRVIALENLVLALLAAASPRQLDVARAMPDFISPRPGAKDHPLTILAAGHMTDLTQRAGRFDIEHLRIKPV